MLLELHFGGQQDFALRMLFALDGKPIIDMAFNVRKELLPQRTAFLGLRERVGIADHYETISGT